MTVLHEVIGLTPDDEAEIAWPVLRAIVLLRDEFTCAMCGRFASQVDHIFPRSRGGSDALLNLQAACKPCNQRKGDALPTERFEFFRHLTLEQVRHQATEIRNAIDSSDAEYRWCRDRIEGLR